MNKKTKKIAETKTQDKSNQTKKGFNGLTAKEWARLSKNVIDEDEIFNQVWDDLSSQRNKHQLEHGAVYPIKLVERLIKIYTKEGDLVFDPFLGIGTSLIAAHNLGRGCIGIELNEKFAKIAQEWLEEEEGIFQSSKIYKIINGDCRKALEYINEETIQLTVTSPPYADFIHKSVEDRKTTHKKSAIKYDNNSTVKPYSAHEGDFGNLGYTEFLEEIEAVLQSNYKITRQGGYAAWVVKDYRDTRNKIPYIPFHSDLAIVGQKAGWKLHDLIIWDQTGQRRLVLLGYPSVFYTNQNCSFIVVFRK